MNGINQLTVYNQCTKGFEPSYFKRQCRQVMQTQSKEKDESVDYDIYRLY